MSRIEPNDVTTSGTAICPGATLGMIGGGQLGQMFAMAAISMGYRVAVFCGDDSEPAAQIAHEVFAAPLNDLQTASKFAKRCAAISIEFENIPVETLEACRRHAPTRPGVRVLAVSQDRGVEKSTLRDAGLPVTPFAIVADAGEIENFAATHQWPVIVKSCRSGYDGRGQHRIENAEQISAVDFAATDHLGKPMQWIAEKLIPFRCEVSVVVARNPSGEIRTFPVFENGHRNHILDLTTLPAALDSSLQQKASQIAIKTAEHLDLQGVLCVEFFVIETDHGLDLMINEIAPRPHNSGHVTIEACQTSQFEQQVRAVCDLPLGDTAMRTPAAAMLNLIGHGSDAPTDADWHRWCHPDVHLHWYGKASCRSGRKMGHVTATGDDLEEINRVLNGCRWQ